MPQDPSIPDPLAQALATLRSLSPAQPLVSEGPAELVAPGADPSSPLTDISQAPDPRTLFNDRQAYQWSPTPSDGPVQNSPDFPVGFDRFGAEHGEPDLEGTAGYDPQQTMYTPPPSVGYGDVEGAEAAQNTGIAEAGKSRDDAASAKFTADQDVATRQADVYDRSANEMARADKDYETARTAANREADAETALWLSQVTDLSAKEPNPDRWFESRSGLGKALWGLGLAFGAASAAMSPGTRNVVLDMVRQEIDKDVALQQHRLERELSTMKLRGQLMDKKQARVLSDLSDSHTRKLSRIQSLEKAWMARAGVPGDAQKAAALAESQALFDKMKLDVIGQRHQTAVQQREQALSRAHSERLAGMQIAQQNRALAQADTHFNKNLQYQYDALRTNAEVDLAKIKGPGNKLPEARAVPIQQTGFMLRDKKTGAVKPVQVRSDEQLDKLNQLAAGSSELYKKMGRLADLIEKDNGLVEAGAGIVAGNLNPEINALMTDIAYATAKVNDPGGRFSEMDVSKGGVQKYGFDPNGKLTDRLKYLRSKSDIVQMLRRDMGNMGASIARKAGFDASIPGQEGDVEVVYDPRSVEAPAVPNYNSVEEKRKRGEITVVPDQPKTIKDYQKRLEFEAKNEDQRGLKLTTHDTTAVDAAIKSFQGKAPDEIRAKAKEALERLRKANPEPDPWNGEGGSEKTNSHLQGDAKATERYIKMAADDAAKRAEQTLKNLEGKLKVMKRATGMFKGEMTEQDAIDVAKKYYGLTDAGPEVAEVFRRVMGK